MSTGGTHTDDPVIIAEPEVAYKDEPIILIATGLPQAPPRYTIDWRVESAPQNITVDQSVFAQATGNDRVSLSTTELISGEYQILATAAGLDCLDLQLHQGGQNRS